MHDYMKALLLRFDSPSERTSKLERKVNHARRQLTARLSKPEKKLLLRLTDLEDELRDEARLGSFISGFRLAQGIQQELLAEQPPYSFEDEDEQQACKQAEQEVNS